MGERGLAVLGVGGQQPADPVIGHHDLHRLATLGATFAGVLGLVPPVLGEIDAAGSRYAQTLGELVQQLVPQRMVLPGLLRGIEHHHAVASGERGRDLLGQSRRMVDEVEGPARGEDHHVRPLRRRLVGPDEAKARIGEPAQDGAAGVRLEGGDRLQVAQRRPRESEKAGGRPPAFPFNMAQTAPA